MNPDRPLDMSRPGGMSVLSPRQAEILGRIGIEVWRWRADGLEHPADSRSETPPDAPTPSDRELAGTARAGNWYQVGDGGSPIRDTWVFCSARAPNPTSDPSSRRLLEEILAAMGLAPGDVVVFCTGDGRADGDAARSARHLLETHPRGVPKRVVALGKDCSEWVCTHVMGLVPDGEPDGTSDSGQVVMLEGDDLGSLMANPLNKAKLWRDMVASGVASVDGRGGEFPDGADP